MTTAAREKAVHAVDTLNDLLGDFIGGVMLFREWDRDFRAGKVPPLLMVNVQKICLSHLVLALCKFIEFYQRFHDVLPSDHRKECKALVRLIVNKGVVEFRNKSVGHIWDLQLNRPLLHSEIMDRLGRLTGHDMPQFLDWINTPTGNVFPSTVVSVVETARDQLMSQYSISADEIINR